MGVSRTATPLPRPQAWFHVDMDGLDAIFRGHGRRFTGATDAFYTSAVERAVEFFAAEEARATFFVIAQDLDDAGKRAAVEAVVAAGHHVACHGYRHRYLDRSTSAEKREEIVDGKRKIEDALGVPVQGFRAPGYSIDFESLGLLAEAGYRYDSSIFPSYGFRRRLGLERLFPEPFPLDPEAGLFELPLPFVGPGLPPFHPCYAFYLGRPYFAANLRAFARRHDYLTFLFHLTDFAERQPLHAGWRLQLYTNNLRSARSKQAFLRRLVRRVRRRYAITSSEEFLAGWPASAPDLAPRCILGVSTTHETGACLVRDGEVVSAVTEERLTRQKLDNRYPPEQSIREVIRVAGIAPEEIDAVAIAGLQWKDLLAQSLASTWQDVRDFHGLNDYIPHLCRMLYRGFYFWRATRYGRVRAFLAREYGIRPKIFYVEHHEAHAASAYRTGSARDALIVTADGVGDDVCLTFSRGRGAVIRRLESHFYPNSFGQFYTAVTQILGFKAGRHEGKITGLAGYGGPNPELDRRVSGTLRPGAGFRLDKRYYAEGFVRPTAKNLGDLLRGRLSAVTVEYRNYKPPLKRLLRGYSREELAYVFQRILEREVLRLTRARNGHGPVDLCLAGGVFANVKLNMALGRGLGARSVYVFPGMGDGGLCVGAALSLTGQSPRPVPSMYLGTGYGEAEIVAALERGGLTWTRPDDLPGAVADELVAGRIVARFDGRMEFGPRALGNRSILYHCADRTVNDWLNHQLRRTEFMPFAPICLYEDAEEYFTVCEGEKRACEFMTYVVPCTERMQQHCPAAVHVDGTARPQLLRREVNPGMHAILEAYKARTGIACLINTSFNMHEEPIVRSPDEAVTAFRQSHLHVLAIGPFLARPA